MLDLHLSIMNPSESPYAMYKYLGEQFVNCIKNPIMLNVQIARFYNVYGPGENIDEKYGNVIGIWRSKILKGASSYCWRWRTKKRFCACS